jgi:hypothetical protein
MCRALRWAAGVLLALDVSGLASSASAQTSASPPADRIEPIRTVRYEERVGTTDAHNRLEEMKVQLALLSDVATFPYPVNTHASGGKMLLLGFVPDAMAKQLALELAQRNTVLKVTDGLKIQGDLKVRPDLRGVEYLQQEGKALLDKNRGDARHPLHLSAQPNGMVAVTGSVYSVEEKLAVSQLFRQLTGCTGVLNQITILPVLRDGQRVVRVTRDGALTMPEAALKTDAGTVSATKIPAMLPEPKPAPIASPKVDIKEEELHLPSKVAPAPSRAQAATPTGGRNANTTVPAIPVSKSNPATLPAEDAKPGAVDVLAAPKVPASWSRGVITWDNDPASKSAISPAPKAASSGSRGVISWESEPPKPQTSPATKTAPANNSRGVNSWESEAPKPQTSPAPKAPASSSRGVIVWESEPPKPSKGPATSAATSSPPPATVNRAPAVMRWESEMQAKPTTIVPTPPRTPPVAQLPDLPQTAVKPQTRAVSQPSTPPRTAAVNLAPAVPPAPGPRPANVSPKSSTARTGNGPTISSSEKPALVSPRRWPPAFDIRPPMSEWGQSGSIAFEEEEEPPAPPTPKPVVRQPVAPRPAVPQLVASEPLAPKLAPPEPLIPSPPQPLIPSPPPPKPAPHSSPTLSRTTWSAWPVSPTDLKQRVESMCGRLARDVQVQTQRDGSVLVKVKVANAAAERQLTNKILTIPEITAPNVHLEMVIGK